jgi:PqqD family protein of HPr-rel-A system
VRDQGATAGRLRQTDVAARDIDGEVVVLDVATRQYHGLNRTAAVLWERLSDGATQHELARTLAESFDIGAEQASADAGRFLAVLRELDLVRPAEEVAP